MKTLKITPGQWDCSDRFIMANTDSDSINVGELNYLNDQYKANAQLIAEAGTVANETGLTPRQLLEQRNELLKEAMKAVHMMRKGGMGFNETGLRNAIKNCEQ